MNTGVMNPAFGVFEQTGFDINVINATSNVLDVSDFSLVTVQLVVASGTFATAVVQAQCSADGTNFVDISGKTITGAGVIGEISVGTEHFRLKVTTAEGGTGTVNITVNAKNNS